jgi:membrane protease YdiL (CAAX protease family)
MMQALTSVPSRREPAHIPFWAALAVTLAMAAVYTALDVLSLPEPLFALLAFIPGTTSLGALALAGLTRPGLNLRLARISGVGLAALAATTILLLPILGSSTTWLGWRWVPALVYAPASGIAQELYFRSALLPGLEHALKGRRLLSLVVHAAIFVGFHVRTFRALPSLPLGVLVAAVLFLAGCGWGWQVQRDRTVLWAMLQHSLFLMLMSLVDWT